jgi:hypothetical protein
MRKRAESSGITLSAADAALIPVLGLTYPHRILNKLKPRNRPAVREFELSPRTVEVYHAKLMTKNEAAAFPYRCVSRSRRARFRADAVFTSVLAGRHYSDERARRRERDARLRRPTIINRAPSLSRDVVQFHRPASASDRDRTRRGSPILPWPNNFS